MIAAGTRLGSYEVTVLIGAGGMGEVYRATDTRLDRTVAIKVLPEHVASDPELKQRFEREAKTLAALSHPHICSIHDVGRQDGIDFLVMEYLEGETLEHRLKKGAVPLDLALQFAIQIADALAAAHRIGIVHRDLKPGNVMLTQSGARLLDFGLAKISAPAVAGTMSMLPTTPPNITTQGAILGTFQYMAPEQLDGQEVDPRTDIFAFGATVYEMTTGRKAFEGQTQASVISAIMSSDPPPVTELVHTAPAQLDRVIRKCLTKNREQRWQSALDLMAQLVWIKLDDTTPSAKLSVKRRRTPALIGALAGIAMLLLAGVTVLLPANVGPEEAQKIEFLVSPPEATATAAEFLAVSPNGRWLAFDGQRFLVNRSTGEDATATPITLIVNWPAALKK